MRKSPETYVKRLKFHLNLVAKFYSIIKTKFINHDVIV